MPFLGRLGCRYTQSGKPEYRRAHYQVIFRGYSLPIITYYFDAKLANNNLLIFMAISGWSVGRFICPLLGQFSCAFLTAEIGW